MKRRLCDADRDDKRHPQDRLGSNRRSLCSLRYPAMFESPLVGGSAPGFYARNVDVFIDAVRSQRDVFSSAADCADAQSEFDFF